MDVEYMYVVSMGDNYEHMYVVLHGRQWGHMGGQGEGYRCAHSSWHMSKRVCLCVMRMYM